MPDRNFATTFQTQAIDGEDRLCLVMVPRQPITGVPETGITLTLKKGATQGQAEEVSSMLNLLAVTLAPIETQS